MSDNPLLHMPVPDPEAVQAVINKELEDTTDEDIDTLILYFRSERAKFAIAEASGKGARGARNPLNPKTKKAKVEKGSATQADVDEIMNGLEL